MLNWHVSISVASWVTSFCFSVLSTQLTFFCWQTFLTWTNCLNSRFRIIGFSVGLYRNFVRKWSHVQSLDRTSFGSAAFQSWISLVVAKNPRSFFTLFFDIHVFFINSVFVRAGSFFFCCSLLCIRSFDCMFRTFRISCFIPKLISFNELVKSLQGSIWKPIRIELWI